MHGHVAPDLDGSWIERWPVGLGARDGMHARGKCLCVRSSYPVQSRVG